MAVLRPLTNKSIATLSKYTVIELAISDTPSPTMSSPSLPPLSLSILGVEPLDEFILEIANFVHHMIMTRPDFSDAKVEVEAKIGVLRDSGSGHRLMLPVLVETSQYAFSPLSSLLFGPAACH